MHIVAISGSLQATSSNTRLLHAVAAAAPADLEVTVWDELADVPPFRPDVADADVAAAVVSLRGNVGAADAVLVATPEYAGGMPGSLKNALDWLVGSGELYGQPVVIVSAAPAPERGGQARRWTEETVGMQGARVTASFTVVVGRDDPTEAVDRVLSALAELRAAGAG